MKLVPTSCFILLVPISGSSSKEIRRRDGQDAKLLKNIRLFHTFSETLSRRLQTSGGGIGSLDQLGGCPDTCSSPEICSFYESQAAGETTIESNAIAAFEDACNAGTLRDCAPSILSTACGLCGDGGGILDSFLGEEEVDMICNSCEFLDCCDGSTDFDVCSKLVPELDGFITDTAATISPVKAPSAAPQDKEESLVPSGAPTPSFNDESLLTPSPVAVLEDIDVFDSTDDGVDDLFGGVFGSGFNESGGGSDDFFDSLFSGGLNNESSDLSDDFLAGVFGGGFNESDGGSDDFFSGLFGGAFNESYGLSDDFFSGLFGSGFNESSNGSDTFFGTILNSWFNESGGLHDSLAGIFGGGFNESVGLESGDELQDLLGGLLEALDNVTGGLFGDLMGGNGTEWVDKGNFSGWENGGILGSYLGCSSEDNKCPVEGFCDCMNGDLAKCSLTLLDDLCSSRAVFSCAPDGLEEMCNSECPPPTRRLRSSSLEYRYDDVLTTLVCSMCRVASCCDVEGKAMNECTTESGFDFLSFFNVTHQDDLSVEEFVPEDMNNSTASDSGAPGSNGTSFETGTDAKEIIDQPQTEGSINDVASNESMPVENTMFTEESVSAATAPDLVDSTSSGGSQLDFCKMLGSFLLLFLF
ncbi:hypothetical protein ACHAW6_011372 [Cyclotella cf. meneghiniana]